METRQLTVDEVTSSAMLIIKEASNEERLLFKQWVAECVMNMGPLGTWKKTANITPIDNSFRKPKDLSATIDLAVFDASNNEIFFKFIPNSPGRIHVDRFSNNATILGSTTPNTINNLDLSEDLFYYHLGGNAASIASVAYMKLDYLSMPVDRYGFPLIPESNLDAYKMYCRWMWTMRENTNQSAIDQAFNMWTIERNKARGRNKMPDEFRAKQAFSKYMSLINNPIF